MSAHAREATRTPVQMAALIFGIIFLVLGVLGFIPGVTTDYGAMRFAGPGSDAHLLGVFQVSVLHNIVHLLLGVAGVALARTWTGARNYLIWGGVITLLLWIYGMLVGRESAANFVPMNAADNWLHFVMGIVMVALGVLLTRRTASSRSRVTPL
ncbi:DUF4383 domain-containing protein [Sphaerisporangium sp. TRM90804]|uniref:DUF4383 domain-containing protein n=1 Tax=Sphaerisporangium sp. TRM90804 TaxID=3031113 RepID=UPI002446BCE1|nr:DUF4383 domain-containing protein [Sphaerisporangium sp. TRM90804]MDH2424416.1 DUF4383 domain-containing protein [Sphaerisporangium sp. TRM90804]